MIIVDIDKRQSLDEPALLTLTHEGLYRARSDLCD